MTSKGLEEGVCMDITYDPALYFSQMTYHPTTSLVMLSNDVGSTTYYIYTYKESWVFPGTGWTQAIFKHKKERIFKKPSII